MNSFAIGKKVLALAVAVLLIAAVFPLGAAADGDFTPVNVLTGEGSLVNFANSTPVYLDKYLTENVFASGYGLSTSTITGLVDGDLSNECLFNGRGATSRWWNGVRYALTEACFASKVTIYSGLPAYIDCYDVYASDSLTTLYNADHWLGEFTCTGSAIDVPVNRSVQYLALIYNQPASGNESARPREIQLWTGDEENTFAPVCLTDPTLNKLADYSCVGVNPSTMATSPRTLGNKNGVPLLQYFATNETNSHADVSQSGSNYTAFQYGFDNMYYIGDIVIDAGTWNNNETWDVYASNSLATLYTDEAKVASVNCDYVLGARVSVNQYASYVALVQTSGYSRIRALRIYTADATGVPLPFVSENVLRTDLDGVVPVVQYVASGNIAYENVISEEKLANFTDGDTVTHKDLSDTLGWNPARKIGAQFTLNNTAYIGTVLVYASLTSYPESYSVYVSDSLETLYSADSKVANAVATNGTTISVPVNRYVQYIAFFCESSTGGPRFKEIEAWTADNSALPTPFTPENVFLSHVTNSRCVQFYPSSHYVGDATRIPAEDYTKFTDGDTSTKTDSYSALDWDPPRYIGIEYSLDDTYYIGNFKIYSGYTTSVDTFDVYASDSLDTLYNNDNCVATGVNCDDTGAQTIAVNKNVRYVTFLISGVTLYCARIAEFEAWTAEETDVVVGYSLTLAGDIGVNFFADTSTVDAETATVTFDWGGHNETVLLSTMPTEVKGGVECYKLTCPVAAKEMNQVVTATVRSEGNITAVETYSVAEYARTVIDAEEGTYTPELVNLMKSMLVYGAKAQLQFDYNTDALIDAGLTYDLSEVDMSGVSAISYDAGTFSAYGLSYVGSTMVLESETSYRLFFRVTDAAAYDGLSVTLNSTELTPESNSGYVIYTIPGIVAKKITNDITVNFNGDPVVFNTKTYISKAMATTDTTLKATMTALYDYNQKAIDYFGEDA